MAAERRWIRSVPITAAVDMYDPSDGMSGLLKALDGVVELVEAAFLGTTYADELRAVAAEHRLPGAPDDDRALAALEESLDRILDRIYDHADAVDVWTGTEPMPDVERT